MTGRKILCTIGTSGKSLREFIHLLKEAGVTRVVDIRLHNTSQLAGYSKKDDLAFILELVGIEYAHAPELAPTDEIIKSFKKVDKDWVTFRDSFTALMHQRQSEQLWTTSLFDSPVNCLLCAEDKPDHCHRRLVAERFRSAHPEIEIRHLG